MTDTAHTPPTTATPGWSIDPTPEAMQVIQAMGDRVSRVRYDFGAESPEYAKVAGSLAHSLVTMIKLGGRVMKDGDLSLVCHNEFIVYGVNWSPANRDTEWPNNLLGSWSVNS